jgi:hypothetical protein
MTTERHAWASSRVSTGVLPQGGPVPPPTCGCGQELDVCTGTHCPRCGTSIHLHAA